MKNCIYIALLILFVSCEYPLKDHYRYESIELSLWSIQNGPNKNCKQLIELDSEVKQGDTIALKLVLNREYYSDDNSRSVRGPIYVERGQKGSDEKIDSLVFKINNKETTQIIFADPSIEGYISEKMPSSGFCQGENCECHSAFAINSIDDFMLRHNNKYDDFLGERTDGEPILFFVVVDSSFSSPTHAELSIFFNDGRTLKNK